MFRTLGKKRSYKGSCLLVSFQEEKHSIPGILNISKLLGKLDKNSFVKEGTHLYPGPQIYHFHMASSYETITLTGAVNNV